MNKLEVRVLRAIDYTELLGITFDELVRDLKINPKQLNPILLKFTKEDLIEKRYITDGSGRIDYAIGTKGEIFLRKLK